ncbi:hypothetical protein ccbrp13_30200 [Ktedonobacteria bacterium brp13]|nr:hypothetical protein ccbrp13_30200 [Ktedonobacteria bacterium brp13]
MPVSYTNRKGQTYTLYKGQTKTGKPRYYFGRPGHSQGEPVKELPSGFTISENINGLVTLSKYRPVLIQPEEVTAIEAEVKRHPEAYQYQIAVKRDKIEIYEQNSLNFDVLCSRLQTTFQLDPDQVSRLRSQEEHYAPRYTPVLRFILLDLIQRRFSVQRMCYRRSSDGWLELSQTGPVAELAHAFIPTLGTDLFYELW